MRKVKNYQVRKESFSSMQNAKRVNPALEIRFRDKSGIHTNTISAGYDDDLYVYREDAETYVLSLNDRMGYVGLQVFSGAEESGKIFFQDSLV